MNPLPNITCPVHNTANCSRFGYNFSRPEVLWRKTNMFEESLAALEQRREKILSDASARVAAIDLEIKILRRQSASTDGHAREEIKIENVVSSVKEGEFRIFDDLWTAVKTVLTKHGALSQGTAIHKDNLLRELQIGQAKLGSAERASRNFLIAIGQHKKESRYEKRTGLCWLIKKD
jgi:hypothetical protein